MTMVSTRKPARNCFLFSQMARKGLCSIGSINI
uniref:Uncharacterized protein n=1 Tax=Arundo donax TaxID=35708 RepID=A0A0A9HEH7_ARUDO